MLNTFLLYFLIFYVFGIILWITRDYDILTIITTIILFAIFFVFGRIESLIYLIIFFVVAESITILLDVEHKKRSYINIIGNCFPAIVYLVFNQPIAALSSISSSFGDTMSSEIGGKSKGNPILITNFKKVEKGTDGAISLLGIIGAIIASAITIAFFLIFDYKLKIALIIGFSAIVGSIIDSYLGAIVERRGFLTNAQTNFLASGLTGLIALIISKLIM
ncbi:MAG: DUF92 domain-containing protein [archaeon]